MLFINNLISEKTTVSIETTDNKTIVNLTIGEEVIPVLSTENTELEPSIRKSIAQLNRANEAPGDNENDSIANIYDNRDTFASVSFYLPGKTKTVLVPQEDEHGKMIMPVRIESVSEEEFNENRTSKHYPRDMVLIVVPNTEENVFTCGFDERNVVYPMSYVNIGAYTLIALLIKWPTWSSLKYPACGYIQSGEDTIAGFKLSFVNMKKTTRNVVEKINPKIAYDTVKEAERIREEKRNTARSNRPSRNNNNASKEGNKSSYNHKGNGNFKKGGNGNKFPHSKLNEAAKGSINRNFRKNGNR